MIIEQLKLLKSKCNLSNQQISERSGVPLPTVNRILSGQTENPSFETVQAMLNAMGGSLDNIGETKEPKVDIYERVIASKNKWISRLFIFSCAMVAENIIMMIIFAIK